MDAGGDITLPGIGPTPKKYVIAGGALIAGIVGYAYWRHMQAATTSAAPPVDPALLAPSEQSFTNPNPNATGSGTVNDTGPPATDAAWTTKAVDDMGNLGFDRMAVGVAIGKYLAGQGLTSDEAQWVRTVWGLDGRPPQHPTLAIVTTTGGSTGPGPKPTDNEGWRNAALAWIIRQPGNAGTTPIQAQVAINDYLAGRKLGDWEVWTVQTIITGTNQQGKHFEAGIGYPPNPPNTPL